MKKVYPRLYSLCSNKDAKVAELGSWSEGEWVWHLVWRRPLFDWENSVTDQLSRALFEARMILGETNRWVWKVESLQMFTVSSAYSLVRRDREVDCSTVFSKLWSSEVVPSALLTAWRVLENKNATRANLVRRGVVVESSLCCLCGKEEESYNHLFFDCIFLAGFGVCSSSGWECRLYLTEIPC